MLKKKVAIIGTAGLPAKYGGFETMTDYLTKHKSEEFDFTVYCGKTPNHLRLDSYNGAKLVYLPFFANGAQSIIYDVISICKSWFKFDALIILGTPGSIILPFLKLFKKTKTIINFGGLEWKRDKWNVFIRKYLKVSETIAIRNATHIVADNQSFCNYILEEYDKKSELIEYGGDHVSRIKPNEEIIGKFPFLSKKYFVSVSRAQPDNNLHILLESFSQLPDKNLVLISNWDQFEYGIGLKKQYAHGYPNIFILDAIYDLKILDTIRSNAVAYIHSHKYCGTAPSLVEAMNLNLAVLAFETDTNFETTEGKALFFKDPRELKKLLLDVNENKINDLSFKMKEIAKRRYTWKVISDKYGKLIN